MLPMTKQRSLNVFLLTMINLATILSIRNWPVAAEYGLASVGFILLALVFFFVPAALISAELATGWPQKGGIFVWVKEAMGPRLGFLAIWLLWVENIVWYPTILSFVAGSFAYAFNPALASHPWYIFSMILAVFWTLTIVNFCGMKISGWISSFAVIFGTILPGLLIIGLGFLWVAKGNPTQIAFTWKGLVPDLSHMSQLAFFVGILLSFFGIEMSAVHAKDVDHPQKNYPRAILYSSLIIVILTILGTLAIAAVIPQKDISLVSGSIEAIYQFLQAFHLEKFIPLTAILVAIGALGGVSTWLAGPCRGLLAAAEKGDFPPFMNKSNKHNMPTNVMLIQAIVVSLLALVFVFMPNVSSSFWILSVLSSQLYLIMYMLLFLSGIILRYRHKNTPRAYKVPGGNAGMWVTALLGIIGCVFAIIVGFFPPQSLNIGSLLFFEGFLLFGGFIFCAIPFIIYHMRKPSWLPH